MILSSVRLSVMKCIVWLNDLWTYNLYPCVSSVLHDYYGQGANCPLRGGESSRWRIVQGAKRPGLGRNVQGRTVQVTKRPVTG